MQKVIDKTTVLVYNIYVLISEDVGTYMQTYRSGHNGADSKSVWEQSHAGSNPALSARKKPRKHWVYAVFSYLRAKRPVR